MRRKLGPHDGNAAAKKPKPETTVAPVFPTDVPWLIGEAIALACGRRARGALALICRSWAIIIREVRTRYMATHVMSKMLWYTPCDEMYAGIPGSLIIGSEYEPGALEAIPDKHTIRSLSIAVSNAGNKIDSIVSAFPNIECLCVIGYYTGSPCNVYMVSELPRCQKLIVGGVRLHMPRLPPNTNYLKMVNGQIVAYGEMLSNVIIGPALKTLLLGRETRPWFTCAQDHCLEELVLPFWKRTGNQTTKPLSNIRCSGSANVHVSGSQLDTYTLDSYNIETLPFVSVSHQRLNLTIHLQSCVPWGSTVMLSTLSNLTSLTLWGCMRFLPCRDQATLFKLPELPNLERLVIEHDSGNFAVPIPYRYPTAYLELFPMSCPCLRELYIDPSLSLRAFQMGTSSFPTTLRRLSLTLTSNLEHPVDLEPFLPPYLLTLKLHDVAPVDMDYRAPAARPMLRIKLCQVRDRAGR